MPKTIIDIAIENELQDRSDEDKALILEYSRRLKENKNLNAEYSPKALSLLNHIVIIATFPFAFSLMLIRNPLTVSYLVNIAPIALVLGVAGLWLAQRRGIRVEKQFLNLMLISFGISIVFTIPFLVAGISSHNLYSLMAASLLYGASLAIFLIFSWGLYGLTVNFQKPQRELAGV
jgi:predicted neutral ceramidase superfamily lipid hydrolase